MEIVEQLLSRTTWEEFLEYKRTYQHLSAAEEKAWQSYIAQEQYLKTARAIAAGDYEPPLPLRREINKTGVRKKRVVYSYPEEFQRILKGIAYALRRYDSRYAPNCYSFRAAYGAGDAIRRLRAGHGAQAWCLKTDISDYFNSIDAERLIAELGFLREEDARLYALFCRMLRSDAAYDMEGHILREKRGAMAGIPVAPFFANIYLSEVDHDFAQRGIPYYRYADDILLFAATEEELAERRDRLYGALTERGLRVNPKKEAITGPGEALTFLGFSIQGECVDLSEATRDKLKGKIRRKARALRRWSARKGLPYERGAKGFVKAMNRKLYTREAGTEFSWSRWFFPLLTTDAGLRELDAYLQRYIRYCITGRHSKGNYRIPYETLKQLGYRSLVHEWYAQRAGRTCEKHHANV